MSSVLCVDCHSCGQEFVAERAESAGRLAALTRRSLRAVYYCPNCGETGEYTSDDMHSGHVHVGNVQSPSVRSQSARPQPLRATA